MTPGARARGSVDRDAAREESDGEALARVASGELGALGIIYDRHQRAVLRFVSRASCDAPDVEDVVHLTFLTVAKIASRYDGRTSCRAWLMGIAARLLSQRRRGAARFARMLGELARECVGASHDPAGVLQARGRLTEVQRALSQMSESKRLVIVMAEIEGLPCEEIAVALGIPIGTVWTRLHSARAALRKSLPDEDRS